MKCFIVHCSPSGQKPRRKSGHTGARGATLSMCAYMQLPPFRQWPCVSVGKAVASDRLQMYCVATCMHMHKNIREKNSEKRTTVCNMMSFQQKTSDNNLFPQTTTHLEKEYTHGHQPWHDLVLQKAALSSALACGCGARYNQVSIMNAGALLLPQTAESVPAKDSACRLHTVHYLEDKAMSVGKHFAHELVETTHE